MYYAGVKWGRCANPSILLKRNGYTTSSKKINSLIETHGIDIFIIRKIRVFATKRDAQTHETRFLRKVDARRNPRFYNGHNNEGAMNSEEMAAVLEKMYGVHVPLQNHDIKKRYNKTCRERYGVDWILQSPEIKQNGMLEKYGVENYAKTDEWRQKTESTCAEKYGRNFYVQTDDFKEKSTSTYMEKYGTTHHTKTPSYKKKVADEKRSKAQRPIVIELRKLCKSTNTRLKRGWYQKSEEDLVAIRDSLTASI
jgi:hypothetical protein